MRREIKIGQKLYSIIFIIAEIAKPILGMDFLQRFKMSFDLAEGRLLHSGTATPFSSTAGRPAISGVKVITGFAGTADQLLKQFPEITDVARATRSLRHNVQCHIRTSGAPIKTLVCGFEA